MSNKEILQLASLFTKTPNATVRLMEEKTSYSKSTIHSYLTSERLKKLNLYLFKKCREVLDKNKEERNIRGGLATKEKFKKLKLEK